MDHRECQASFLSGIDGTMSAGDQESFQSHLACCEECRDAFRQYRAICRLESEIAACSPPECDIADQVMSGLEGKPLSEAAREPVVARKVREAPAPTGRPVDLLLVVHSLSAVAAILALTFAALLYAQLGRMPAGAPVLHAAALSVAQGGQPILLDLSALQQVPTAAGVSSVAVMGASATAASSTGETLTMNTLTRAAAAGRVLSYRAEEARCNGGGRCLKVTLLMEGRAPDPGDALPEPEAQEEQEAPDIGQFIRAASLEL